MATFEVVRLEFSQLTSDQKAMASNNGCGKEYANYLRVRRNGLTVFLESDAMEPEDAKFSRDLKWIKEAIEYAYHCGEADERGRIQDEKINHLRTELAELQKATP